jgi:integrase
MPVYHDTAKKRWRFTFNRVIHGERHRASRLLPADWNRSRAEAYDRKETGRLYAIATGIEQPSRLIDDAVKLYLEHRLPQHRAGHKAALHLAALLPWYEGRGLQDLPDVARKYAADRTGELAPGTIRNRLAYLKAACRYAWKHHHLVDADPTARMHVPPAHNERQVYLRLPELEQLVRACRDPDVRAIMRIAFYTGLRWISELLPLTPASIKRRGRELWLDVGMTKNGTPRMVPVHAAIRADLRRLPFTRHWRDYYAAFEAARKRAGLAHVRMHDLRHSLASAIISAGGTLPDVQAALHHKSVASARRYAHLYPERLQKVILSIGKRKP